MRQSIAGPRPRRSRPALAAALVALITLGSGTAVPAEVRELSTDRPDVTESPFSIPRGWMQVEMDVLAFSREEFDFVEIERLGIAASNLKIGITDRADFQIVFEPYVRQRITTDVPGEGRFETEGHDTGELALRLKWNLVGNDGGRYALGLLPWVAWDTGTRSGDAIDAFGIAAPFGTDLTERVGFGAMAEWSAASDERALLGTATLSLDLGGSLGVFGEIVAERVLLEDLEDEWLNTLNAGATYGIGPDLQLDAGARFGLTEGADDVVLFVGFAARRPAR